jgi:excisionase family DNA binding protein
MCPFIALVLPPLNSINPAVALDRDARIARCENLVKHYLQKHCQSALNHCKQSEEKSLAKPCAVCDTTIMNTITVNEAARTLGISRQRIDQYIREKRLAVVAKAGRERLIDADRLAALRRPWGRPRKAA